MAEHIIDTVVVSDGHGEYESLDALYARYGDSVRYVIGGDSLHGGDSRKYLDRVGEYCIQLVLGNHEIVPMAAMYEKNPDNREIFQYLWNRVTTRLTPYQNRMTGNYGIPDGLPYLETADRLAVALETAGHAELLASARLYYEGDDFIVVHGGLTDEPWEVQKKELDAARARFEQGDYSLLPVQVFDEDHSLARSRGTEATPKTLVTGHEHFRLPAQERVSADGRRVWLASALACNHTLFAWQSWDNRVVEIEY